MSQYCQLKESKYCGEILREHNMENQWNLLLVWRECWVCDFLEPHTDEEACYGKVLVFASDL
jgi:hypothetical protein